jgi:hypothetical protein
MTRCLRIRVGQATYLIPSDGVGAIALYRQGDVRTGHRRRVIDARRMAVGSSQSAASPTTAAVAVEWIDSHGRIGGIVLVDEVEGLVDIDAAEVAALPRPAHALNLIFDGFWYDKACAAFLLRIRAAEQASFAELRRLARALAPLTVADLPR